MKTLRILNIVTFAIVVVVNGLASTLPLNGMGHRPNQRHDTFPLYSRRIRPFPSGASFTWPCSLSAYTRPCPHSGKTNACRISAPGS